MEYMIYMFSNLQWEGKYGTHTIICVVVNHERNVERKKLCLWANIQITFKQSEDVLHNNQRFSNFIYV